MRHIITTSDKMNFKLDLKGRSYSLTLDDKKYTGVAVEGNDAVWIPYSKECGLKIVLRNYDTESIEYIKSLNLDIFPKIYNIDVIAGRLYMILENVPNIPKSNLTGSETWIPSRDKEFVQKRLMAPLEDLTKCSKAFIDHNLVPEDEWYKGGLNFINGKIIDFNQFKHFPEKYRFDSNGVGPNKMKEIYADALARYSKMVARGMVKWKGKIYEGFRFDNGYDMVGYSSDGEHYDSYLKLNFVSFLKSKGKRVLDIGSNQGFFTFQAANHGAEMATGLELTKEDVMLANDINNNIFKLDNVEFVQGDAGKYIMADKKQYGLIIFSSTLHQMFPNFKGADALMRKLAGMSPYMHFETPVNHPLMTLSLQDIQLKLRQYYKKVRLTYVYNAYSSGYRAEFVCMNF